MDTKRIALIGFFVIATVALAGGVYLSAKGITAPVWLLVILTGLGVAVKSPFAADKADDKKDGAS